MREHKNFGLSKQERPKEEFDNWDLGFISEDSIKSRIADRKADTARKNMQTEVMQKIMSEPTQTQNQGDGIDPRTALAISVVLVLGFLVGYGIIKKKRNTKQAVPKNGLPVNEIV